MKAKLFGRGLHDPNAQGGQIARLVRAKAQAQPGGIHHDKAVAAIGRVHPQRAKARHL
jgi:hypothetical protein